MTEKSSKMPTYIARRSSKRQSGLTPEKLRDKIIEAIPEWSSWARPLRQAYVLLPTHGTGPDGMGAICEALGWKLEKLDQLIERSPSFRKRLAEFESLGHYPKVARDKLPLPHSYLVEQFANEASVVALVALEITARESPGNLAKIVDGAGWFLNIQADTEREKRVQAVRIDRDTETYQKKLQSRGRRKQRKSVSTNGTSGLVSFERGLSSEDAARELERVRQPYAETPENTVLDDPSEEPDPTGS